MLAIFNSVKGKIKGPGTVQLSYLTTAVSLFQACSALPSPTLRLAYYQTSQKYICLI